MLPFQYTETFRYGFRLITLRLLLLRFFNHSALEKPMVLFTSLGMPIIAFKILSYVRALSVGLYLMDLTRFTSIPKLQKSVFDYSPSNPFRLLYVSIIDQYKHQWNVVQAVAELRMKYKINLTLDLVGPFFRPSLTRLHKSIRLFDPTTSWVNYKGVVPYSDLHHLYHRSHLGVFASSCENMPNILLETMASGLPIACSNFDPMPEILKDGGLYFDPLCPASSSCIGRTGSFSRFAFSTLR